MGVVIGSARIGEEGKVTGGNRGDQKQGLEIPDFDGEVSMQNFYISKKGWYVVRPKSQEHAKAIAEKMVTACNNPNVGYNQDDRYSLSKYGVASPYPVNCDCSSLVRQCVKEGTGIDPGEFNTSTECSTLSKTGLFQARIEYTSGLVLAAGDILVTKTKGHTAIVVSADGQIVPGSTVDFYVGAYLETDGELKDVPQFSNSSLVGYVNRLSATNSVPRYSLISCITLHSAKAKGSVRNAAQLINTTGKGYHYVVDNDGMIGLFVDECMAINNTGDIENDHRSVQIICMNDTLAPNYTISEKCQQALIDLCHDICRRNFIFRLEYNKKYPEQGTLTLHSQFDKSSNCPGPYVEKNLTHIIDEVNKQIMNTEDSWVTVNHRLADSETSALRVQNTVSLGAIHPYVAKIDKGIYNVDYNSLKKIGVVGVMLDGGYLFDSAHDRIEYKADAITQQVKEVEKAALPYGFFFTTRARNAAEANNECRAFRRVIYRHSPKLGVWVRPNLIVSSEDAAAIIERFYSSFVDWGLKSRCGIYATKKQAKLINWPEQASYMPLWLEGEMTSIVNPSDELLTPSFFKLDDLTNRGQSLQASTPSYNPWQINSTQPTSGQGAVTRISGEGYTDIILEPYSQYTGFKSWEPYTTVTLKTSQAYKILHSPEAVTDSEGFRKIDNRYLVAVGTGITNGCGVYLDIYLENGAIIQCITGDQKADRDTLNPAHVYMDTSTRCCSEFAVDRDKLMKLVKRMGDCSYRTAKWQSKVVKFRVYNKNWFKK